MSPTPEPPVPGSPIHAEDLAVQHPDWGRIHVRNKHLRELDRFGPERVVILQHGATYGSTAFDLPLGGLSWMDYLARRGFDAYCLDLPGYGLSERPAIMDEPPEANPPFMRTPDAANCLGAVIDFVCGRRQVPRVCLVGWSWGTAIASFYAVGHQERVERLTLYAPVWNRDASTPSPIHVEGEIGAYRTVTRAASLARRQGGLSDEQKPVVMPPAWFDQWWTATAASDPAGGGETIRAPNGVVQDGAEYWSVARPLYDPGAITAPVLVVVGEWDNDTPPYMAQTVFPLFTGARWKRLSVLSGGTHAMLMERNRILLFRTVQQFLEEEEAPGADAVE